MLDKNPKLTLRNFIDGESISKNFNCGEETLNNFIHKEISAYQRERLGITYLIHLDSKLVGFVTMSQAIEYSAEIGCRLLILNSLPSSIEFYNKCNFKQLKGQEKRREKTMYQVIPKELFQIRIFCSYPIA